MSGDLTHHGDAELGPGLADFAVNVTDLEHPRWLQDALAGSLADLHAYPRPDAARRAVAARHGRAPEEVLLTSGAAEAFVLLARVLAPADPVVVHPQFTEPEAALRAAGHPVRRVCLAPPFTLADLAGGAAGGLAAALAGADAVFVGNPTNPTSVAHRAGSLAALAAPGRVLVVDEAFSDAVPGEPDSLADCPLPGVVVLRSLTKTWGLAGLRVGYLLGPADLVAELARAQPLWPVSSPALAALTACSTPAAVALAQARARRTAADRDALAARLLDLGLEPVTPAAGPFLLVAAPPGLHARLRALGVAVRGCGSFPGLGNGWIRIAVRAPQACGPLLEALQAARAVSA